MSSTSPQLPQSRIFYRIGEVSELTGLEQHVLRFWESEFPQIKPDKGTSGHRLYTKKDVDAILLIKHLLYKEGLTIAGARRRLNSKADHDRTSLVIEFAKKELRDILEILK